MSKPKQFYEQNYHKGCIKRITVTRKIEKFKKTYKIKRNLIKDIKLLCVAEKSFFTNLLKKSVIAAETSVKHLNIYFQRNLCEKKSLI